MSLVIPDEAQGYAAVAPLVKPVQERLRNAYEWRRQFEGSWQLSLALAAGKHWQTYDRTTRTLRRIQDTDPRYKDRELYTADMVNEYRTTMLGELGQDSERPQLLLARDDQASEAYAAQANRALTYGWEQEWQGDEILSEIDRLVIDLGTAAVRVRWDPDFGPVVGEVPYSNGQPVLDPRDQMALMQEGPTDRIQMGEVRRGKIRWQPLSVFNLLVPPGCPHERDFPWQATDVPTPLEQVQEIYGPAAADLQEDTDIGSVLGTNTSDSASAAGTWAVTDGRKSRLRDHVRLVTYFEHATGRYPDGRTIVFAGKELRVLDYRESLDYRKPDGTPCSGITYFHWWRVTGRFWSRSLIDAITDGQRMLDKRVTQLNEMIDRSMSFVFVERNSKALDRAGVPGEFIELEATERQPVIVPGIPPGAWMQQDVEAIREHIDHATGIKAPRLGENPASITTYSQLALVNESEQVKRQQIHRERKMSVKSLVEDSLYDIRRYWGPQRQTMLAGDEDKLQAEIFDATRLPPFFIVEVAHGTPKPIGQAAKLKMIEDIYNAGIQAGQPPPLSWLKDSYEAGQPLDLPDVESDHQSVKAQLENHQMMEGQMVPVAYYDRVDIHIPIHRMIQDEAMAAGDQQRWQLVEQHVQLHMQAAQQNAMQLQAAQMQGQASGPKPQLQPEERPQQ